jgi:hypothetical protein
MLMNPIYSDSDQIYRFDFLEETYSTIQSALVEAFNSKEDAFFNNSSVDHLEGLIAKINFIKKTYPDELDLLNSTRSIENELFDILNFNIQRKYPSLERLEYNQRHITEMLFYTLFFNKYSILAEFIANFVLRNKTSFIQRYKPTTKNDALTNQNKQEIKFNSPEDHIIVTNIQDIVEDVLGNSVIGIDEVLIFSSLDINQINVIREFIEFSDSKELYSRYTTNLENNSNFSKFVFDVKLLLIEVFRSSK